MAETTDTDVMTTPPDKPDQQTGGARIVVTYEGKTVAKYRLAKRKVMIGRRQGCDIRINSRSASRHHAQIFSVLDSDYVLDLDSKNGTYVNGKRTKKHALEHGDVISIGGYELEYTRPESDQ